MIFHATRLSGAFIVEMEQRGDDRGFFARNFCRKEFEAHRLNAEIQQVNIGFNKHRRTLRGLHYQVSPYAETKVVRCTNGALYDVILDLRPASPTYRQWMGVELTAENRLMLYVPEGFAHGYLTLRDNTEVLYFVSEFYAPGAERGIRWNDPAFDIVWPEKDDLVISEKDKNWPDWASEIDC